MLRLLSPVLLVHVYLCYAGNLAWLPVALFPVVQNVRPTPYCSFSSGFGHESQQICVKALVTRLAGLPAETLLLDFYNHITSVLPALIYEWQCIHLF